MSTDCCDLNLKRVNTNKKLHKTIVLHGKKNLMLLQSNEKLEWKNKNRTPEEQLRTPVEL